MMARPPLPIGSWGRINVSLVRPGVYRAIARYRDLDGTTRRLKATGSSPAAAQRVLRELLAERTAPAGDLISRETRLHELASYWLEALEEEARLERTTLDEYRRIVDSWVLPPLGGLRLREVTTGRLDRVLRQLRTQSVNRQRKAKVVLGSMLDLAVRHDALTVNPVRALSRVHREKPEPKALTVDDLATLRAALRMWTEQDRPGPRSGPDLSDIVEVMLATGCRIGEVLALRWSDVLIDGAPPTLTVSGTIKTEAGRGTYRKSTPKTDASARTIALPAFAVEIFRRRRADHRDNDLDAVFATRTGAWHQVANVERRWRSVREGTGLEWVTPHTFRRTVATLLSETLGSEQAARQLGHSSADITREHYIARPALTADFGTVLENLGRLARDDDSDS